MKDDEGKMMKESEGIDGYHSKEDWTAIKSKKSISISRKIIENQKITKSNKNKKIKIKRK
jgi:hypothetical protein